MMSTIKKAVVLYQTQAQIQAVLAILQEVLTIL